MSNTIMKRLYPVCSRESEHFKVHDGKLICEDCFEDLACDESLEQSPDDMDDDSGEEDELDYEPEP